MLTDWMVDVHITTYMIASPSQVNVHGAGIAVRTPLLWDQKLKPTYIQEYIEHFVKDKPGTL